MAIQFRTEMEVMAQADPNWVFDSNAEDVQAVMKRLRAASLAKQFEGVDFTKSLPTNSNPVPSRFDDDVDKRVQAQFDRIAGLAADYEKTRLECKRLLAELGVTEDELIGKPEGTMAKLEEGLEKARISAVTALKGLTQVPTLSEEAKVEAQVLLAHMEALDEVRKDG